MPNDLCVICGTRATREPGNGTYADYACPRCGSFRATDDFELLWPSEHGAASPSTIGTVSGWIRQNSGRLLQSGDIPKLIALRPLPVAEKATRLLKLLERRNPIPGERFNLQCDDPGTLGECWAAGLMEIVYLAGEYLGEERKYLLLPSQRHLSGNAITRLMISPAGWSFLESQRFPNASSDIGFVAMWFNPALAALKEDGLKAGIALAGYEPKVVIDHEHVNRIDDEIIALIRSARLVVADFTGTRGGVYFEAGFAMGLGLPVIWTCSESTLARDELHFDVDHYNFLTWSEGRLGEFAERLRRRIESVIGRGPR